MAIHTTDEDLRAWVRLACEESLASAEALRLAAHFGGPRSLYAQPLTALRAVVSGKRWLMTAGDAEKPKDSRFCRLRSNPRRDSLARIGAARHERQPDLTSS